MFSLPDKSQCIKILKAALYVGVSGVLDYLISKSVGTTFGILTPLINVILVSLKQLVTPVK